MVSTSLLNDERFPDNWTRGSLSIQGCYSGNNEPTWVFFLTPSPNDLISRAAQSEKAVCFDERCIRKISAYPFPMKRS